MQPSVKESLNLDNSQRLPDSKAFRQATCQAFAQMSTCLVHCVQPLVPSNGRPVQGIKSARDPRLVAARSMAMQDHCWETPSTLRKTQGLYQIIYHVASTSWRPSQQCADEDHGDELCLESLILPIRNSLGIPRLVWWNKQKGCLSDPTEEKISSNLTMSQAIGTACWKSEVATHHPIPIHLSHSSMSILLDNSSRRHWLFQRRESCCAFAWTMCSMQEQGYPPDGRSMADILDPGGVCIREAVE